MQSRITLQWRRVYRQSKRWALHRAKGQADIAAGLPSSFYSLCSLLSYPHPISYRAAAKQLLRPIVSTHPAATYCTINPAAPWRPHHLIPAVTEPCPPTHTKPPPHHTASHAATHLHPPTS